jgi:hypothetical protein
MIKNFDWNIKEWLGRFLDRKKRKSEPKALIWSLLAPMQDIVDEFAELALFWRRNTLYNSQQGVLQALLNNIFDNTDRRIRVVTLGDLFPDIIIYHDLEVEPEEVILEFDSENTEGPIIYHYSESDGLPDYIVFVPTALSGEEDRIKGYVNRYNLADKTFLIEYE